MSESARRELVDAIRDGRIDNATRFAEDFAARHKLNPSTVRSSISRLRRELGMLKRGPHRAEEPGRTDRKVQVASFQPNITPMTLLKLSDASHPALARLGAA